MCPALRIINTVLLLALAAALPAHARLVAASEAKIYRYVEKSTCYTIITNIEPADEEVAAPIPKGRTRASGFCSPDARARELPDDGPLRVSGRLVRDGGYGFRHASLPMPLPRKRRVLRY